MIRDSIVEEASSSILDPISRQITAIVLTSIGLGQAPNGFFGNNVYITNDYTKASLTSDEDHNALISMDRCDVKMGVSWNPTDLKWDGFKSAYTQAYGRFTQLDKTLVPVFYDKVADVRITEHQVPCVMTFDFSLMFKNREHAFMAISAITNTSLKDSVLNFHDLSYYYPVSQDMFDSLYQIYKLRQASLYPLNFAQYLSKGSKTAIQYVQQRAGPKFEIIVKKQQIQAVGVLEWNQTGPTVIEENRGVDRFQVDFTYTLQFARPDVLRMYYPVVVCNQIVPYTLLRAQQQSYLPTIYGQFQEKSITRILREMSTNLQYTIRLPQYDDFRPPQYPAKGIGFAEFFDAVVLLDPGTSTKVDLLDIGFDIKLHDTAIAIMKLHGNEIFGTEGLFNISVFANKPDSSIDLPIDPSLLSIDSNLVVSIAMTNALLRYHIVISEATNLRYLNQKWLPTIIAYRTFYPVTIIKNLQILIDRGYCYLDKHNILLQVIDYQIRKYLIDAQIATLITAGHINHYAYSYATTAEQWAGFLMHAHSPVDGALIYDHYTDLCIVQGLMTQAELGSGYIRTKNGYPFLPRNVRGISSSINTPLRIENVIVKVKGGYSNAPQYIATYPPTDEAGNIATDEAGNVAADEVDNPA